MPISWNYKELACLLFIIVFYFYFAYAQMCYHFYVICFNWMILILVTASCSFADLGNNLLYKCKGIMFPSLPVSTLYGTIIETWFDNVFRFAVITNYLLLKIIEFIFTMSIWSSSCCWSSSFSSSWIVLFLTLLQISLKCLTLQHSANFFP